MIIARFWLGSVKQSIRTAHLPKGCKLSAIYFRYGPGEHDWHSGAH